MTYPPTAPLPAPSPGRRLTPATIVVIAVMAVLGLLCGIFVVGGAVNRAIDAGGATPAPTSAVQNRVNDARPLPPTSTGTGPKAGSGTVVVPNGVGLDYQSAQDRWRAAGLHVSPATDATGAHRLPVIDSNWLVLSQDPPAGTVVDKGASITATVKKYTDD